MEGVLASPGIDWSFIWAAIGSAISFMVFATLCTLVLISKRRRVGSVFLEPEKFAVVSGNQVVHSGEDADVGVIYFFIALLSFIAIWPLLGIGLYSKPINSVDCFGTNYATEGVYRVDKGTFKEDMSEYFEMYLEGKMDKDSPEKIVACIKIPFKRVSRNHKYATSLEARGYKDSVPLILPL